MIRDTCYVVALASLAALLITQPALADETEPQPLLLYYEGTMLEGVSYDTGWLPDSSAEVRIRFEVVVDGDVIVAKYGMHHVSWPEAFMFHLEGSPDGGDISVDYGLTLNMYLEYDLGVLGSGSYTVPLDDYLPDVIDVLAETQFTPYMLEGHPDWVLEFEGDGTTRELVEAPIGLATGITLNLTLDMRPTLQCDYRCDEIDLGSATMDRESEPVLVPWTDEGFLTIPITAHSTLYCVFNITLVPTASLCIGTCFDLASIDVDLAIDDDSHPLDFDTVEVSYEYPVLDIDTLSINFGEVDVGDETYVDLLIRNTGRGYLEAAFALDPWDGAFYYFPFSGVAIPGGDEREVRLYFTPASPGEHTATLEIESTAPVDSTATVSLTGTGVSPTPDDASTDPDSECDDCSRHSAACGCHLVGAPSTPAPLLILLALLALALRRPPRA
jgi:hypothetical protein